MLTTIQVRESAWETLRSAKALLESRQWVQATSQAGLAVEQLLKARICADQNLAGFPEDLAEAKIMGRKDLITHNIEELLHLTKVEAKVKSASLGDWSTCLQWNPNLKYQAKRSQTKKSATEMIRAADAIFRAIEAEPDLEIPIMASTENPFAKLWAVERELSIKMGSFTLFAIGHRKDGLVETADILVSAPWINPHTRDGANEIAEQIQKTLSQHELLSVSGVIALSENNAVVEKLTEMLTGEHISVRFTDTSVNGVELDDCTIITAVAKNARN